MKIVCIAASFIPSNTANSIQVVKASHALAALGHEVTLLVPGDETIPWEDLKTHYGLQYPFAITWISENLAYKRYDFAYKAVYRAKRIKPDLVYTWVLQAGVLALWFDLPTALELHDRVTGKIGPWLFRRFWASETRKRLITNTHALRKILIEEFNVDPAEKDILVAPNGVDLTRYQGLPSPSEARKALGLPDVFTAGYTGHFYAGRGMALMFDLAKAMPNIHFLWVGGEPDDVAKWIMRVQSDGVQNITLTGFVDNARLPKYQAASNVLLMPYGKQIAGSGGGDSSQVASPMKMFEYMAAGRAILSSDLPVIHEVLTKDTAVFCPAGDLLAWIEALSELKANLLRCQALGESARKAVEGFTWESRAERAMAGFV